MSDNNAEFGSAPEPRFVRRNWQILSMVAGNLVFLVTILLWKGPIAERNRQVFRDTLDHAIRLYQQGQYIDSTQLLAGIERSLWRVPESAGLVYALRGLSAQQLAKVAPLQQAAAYKETALAYLEAAQPRKIPPPWRLTAQEAYGRALQDADRFTEALTVLTEAMHSRRIVQAQLYRLAVQATLEQVPRDQRRLATLVRQWSMVPNLSPSDRDLCDAASELVSSEQYVDLRKLLARAVLDPEEIPPIDDMAYNELRVEFELTAANPDAAVEFLAQQRLNNDTALSDVLLSLQQLALQGTPIDRQAALNYGRQRYQLDTISVEEINDALIRQAEIWLDLKRPREARELLVRVEDPGQQRFNARYLLGLSYFREAQNWDRLSLEDWEEMSPLVQQYRWFITNVVAGVSEADPRQTRVSQWRRQLADAVSPAAIKDLLAHSAYQRAVEMFEKLQEDQRQSDQGVVEREYARSMLMSAVAYTQQHQYTTADQIYENVMNFFPKSDFAMAARFLRADSHRKAGISRAIEEFAEACEMAPRPFENEFLPLEDLQQMFRDAWQVYDQSQQYENAMAIAEMYRPFSPPGDANEMEASSALTFASSIEDSTKEISPEQRPAVAARARDFYRRAAQNFEVAANFKEEQPSYPDLIWQGALASFRGQDYKHAGEMLELFARLHGPGERDFLAHLLWANSLMAQEQWAPAREMLERVLEQYPSSPDRFEGRIRLAQCYTELADVEPQTPEGTAKSAELIEAALTLLRKNTDGLGIDLEPTAREWQESLFELGRILYMRERFDEAIPRLREAIRRFPDVDRSWEAQARLADAYFRSAELPAAQLENETTPQVRTALEQDKLSRLQRSLHEYRILVGKLKADTQEQPLPDRKRLLMIATFRIADVLMAMEDWPAAVEAYTTAANRYQDQPECLAAYVAIANAYWRMSRPDDAQSTLRQAKWVLKQMDEQSFVGSALTRQQWSDRLDSLVGNL